MKVVQVKLTSINKCLKSKQPRGNQLRIIKNVINGWVCIVCVQWISKCLKWRSFEQNLVYLSFIFVLQTVKKTVNNSKFWRYPKLKDVSRISKVTFTLRVIDFFIWTYIYFFLELSIQFLFWMDFNEKWRLLS